MNMKERSTLSSLFGRAAKAQETVSAASPEITKKPRKSISLRLTEEEFDRLERDAAGMSRSAYIRERLFGAHVKPRKTRGKHPVQDHAALARVLGAIGKSGLSKELNELAWAESNGVVRLDASTSSAIRKACGDITAMRDDLVTALGLSGRST